MNLINRNSINASTLTRGHFNEIARHAALEFCASRPEELGQITPMLHAMHEHGSPLHYHDGTRADDMVEGGKQGGVAAAPARKLGRNDNAASHLAALSGTPTGATQP